MIRIATDSTCDLPPSYFQEYDVTVVPINIQFGTETYEDGVTIDRETFIRKIDEMGILPTTSQPSAGQFEQYYEKLRQEGATDIISLHVTAKLSGTYQSAVMAQEMMEDRVRVHPFDSESGTVTLGFMCMEASRMSRAGKSVAEILSRMEEIRDQGCLVITLKDLRYAQMSGRTGRLQSSLASLLSIKPIVLLEDGLLDVVEQVRTQGKAIDRLIDILAERVGRSEPVNLAVVHARSPEAGQALLEKAQGLFNCQETFMADLTSSLVVHFGPGTLGLFAYRV
ncbi:MAG: DegV family EDD domain-containing protein [Anaerolineae bacterium]|nr:DegV family EDD domain-containing protein [Anaerolineae bacterium]